MISVLVLHHTASPRTWTREDVHRAHVEGRGWRDVGYNELIFLPPGASRAQIVLGRPYDLDDEWEPWEYGAHAANWNARSWGCALVGNYDIEEPEEALLRAAAVLFAERCVRWGLDPLLDVRGHRELSGASTVCPGRKLDLPAFRARVAALL